MTWAPFMPVYTGQITQTLAPVRGWTDRFQPRHLCELEAIASPLPAGDLGDRARAAQRRLHGTCDGDAAALHADLLCLELNGVFRQGGKVAFGQALWTLAIASRGCRV